MSCVCSTTANDAYKTYHTTLVVLILAYTGTDRCYSPTAAGLCMPGPRAVHILRAKIGPGGPLFTPDNYRMTGLTVYRNTRRAGCNCVSKKAWNYAFKSSGLLYLLGLRLIGVLAPSLHRESTDSLIFFGLKRGAGLRLVWHVKYLHVYNNIGQNCIDAIPQHT